MTTKQPLNLNSLATKSVSEKLAENKTSQKSYTKEARFSIMDKLNQSIEPVRRVGIDVYVKIDNEIEDIVNNALKDKTTKKEVYNEVLEIGWKAWKEKLNKK